MRTSYNKTCWEKDCPQFHHTMIQNYKPIISPWRDLRYLESSTAFYFSASTTDHLTIEWEKWKMSTNKFKLIRIAVSMFIRITMLMYSSHIESLILGFDEFELKNQHRNQSKGKLMCVKCEGVQKEIHL